MKKIAFILFATLLCFQLHGQENVIIGDLEDDFVNIDSVVEEKHRACYCHASQHMDEVFGLYHDQMEHFRGLQSRCKFAEAFVKHHQGTTAIPL